MKTINIKLDNPPVDVAVANMITELELCKLENIDIVKIIHGYGSHGVGGLIKLEAIKALKNMRNKKQILDFIPGEQFSTNNKYYKKLIELYPELILNYNTFQPNSGITIVIFKLGGFGNI